MTNEQKFEGGRERNLEEMSILDIHNLASEARRAVYGSRSSSRRTEDFTHGQKSFGEMRRLIGDSEELSRIPNLTKIEDYFAGRKTEPEEVLEAIDSVEEALLRKKEPDIFP